MRLKPTLQNPLQYKNQQNIAKANPTSGNQQQGRAPSGGLFPITNIPGVMDKLGGVQGPRFMRRWFNSPAYELPMEFKTGRKDARLLNKSHLMEDLPFDWLQKSKRVGPLVDLVVKELSNVYEFNGRVGRVKSALSQLSPGLIVLMLRLDALGLLDAKRKILKDGGRFFGDLPAIELDYTSQFNRVDVGTTFSEKAFDSMDDVYLAFGSFSIKLAATEFRTYSSLNGAPAIEISEIGLYARDTYDFLNKKDEDQLLGYWNDTGVRKPDPLEYALKLDWILRDWKRFFRVTNNNFNEHRRTTGKGGDFMVFTTVKRVPVSILVHLNSIDFQEYLDRKGD